MLKTDRKTFFNRMITGDIVMEVIGDKPYTVIYRERHGGEVGRIKDNADGIPSEYFLTEPEAVNDGY